MQSIKHILLVSVTGLVRACQRMETWGFPECCLSDLTLECDAGNVLEIVSGLYGRQIPSSVLCWTVYPNNDDTMCEQPSAQDKILDICQGMTSCVIEPTNEFFGGNPCVGTYKYVEVTYYCKGGFMLNNSIRLCMCVFFLNYCVMCISWSAYH